MSTPPVTAASLQMPSDPSAPVILDFYLHALKVTLVGPDGVAALGMDFGKPGVYVLMGERSPAGSTEVYVGQTRAMSVRLNQHRGKPPIAWWRAVAVIRDTTHGFNSAEIGYLEGRVAAQIGSLPAVTVSQGLRSEDTTLPDHLLVQLDGFVPTIISALRIAGLDVRPEATTEEEEALDEEVTQPSRDGARRTYTPVPGTVADLLAAGLLAAGAKLSCKRAARTGQATVNASGQLVVNGVAYDSPSMAGKKALDVQSVNGWTAWVVADGSGATLDGLRALLRGNKGTVSLGTASSGEE